MRVTVCELDSSDLDRGGWEALCRHVHPAASRLVLLPEMPFGPPFWSQSRFIPALWREAVSAHLYWLERLGELGAEVVVGTRPVEEDSGRFNEGFLWRSDVGLVPLRRKAFLPEQPGAHEATWTTPGPRNFSPFRVDAVRCALAICTELWHLPSLATYAGLGVDILLTPRATRAATDEKWLALGRVAAVSAGAYGLSSNRRDTDGASGGGGWIFDPDGQLLARTDAGHPSATVLVAPEFSRKAKTTYPRYIFGSA